MILKVSRFLTASWATKSIIDIVLGIYFFNFFAWCDVTKVKSSSLLVCHRAFGQDAESSIASNVAGNSHLLVSEWEATAEVQTVR